MWTRLFGTPVSPTCPVLRHDPTPVSGASEDLGCLRTGPNPIPIPYTSPRPPDSLPAW